jgi:tetratricopeptide (TPR) repeat protein
MDAAKGIVNNPTSIATAGPSHETREVLAVAAAIVLLGLIFYRSSLSGEFVRLDDYQYVVDNELVRKPSWSGLHQFFAEVTKPSTVEGYYQPLTMASLMVDVLLAGGDEHPGPFIFHLSNILLHALSAVVIMIIVRRLTGGLAIPILAGILFLVHPAQVESVSWISQRKTVLATLFALGGVWSYLCGGEAPKESRRRYLAAAFVLYVLASLAKPTVMLLPMVFFLLDFWPLGRGVRGGSLAPAARGRGPLRELAKLLPEKIPFLIVMIVTAYVAWVSQASSAMLQRPSLHTEGAAMKWAGLLCYNLLQYAGNVVWPFALSPYRALPDDLTFANPVIVGAVIATTGLFIVWLLSARYCRPLFVGLTAFGILLLPALGPVRFTGSCVADRFTYLPIAFLLLPLAAGAKRLETTLGPRGWLAWAALGAIALPLVPLMRAQQGIWRTSKALYTHVAAAVPDLPKAHGNLALIALEEERLADAEEHLQKAMKLTPEDPEFLHLLGRVYTRTDRAARAVPLLERAVEKGLGKATPTGYMSLAEAHLVSGDLSAAREHCDKAVALGRTPGDTYASLGVTAMKIAQRYDAAVEYDRLAVAAEPENSRYHWNLGTALHAAGRFAEALREYEIAVEMNRRQGHPEPRLEIEVAKLRMQYEPAAGVMPTQPADPSEPGARATGVPPIEPVAGARGSDHGAASSQQSPGS